MIKRARLKCPDADKYDAVSLPTCATEKFRACDACVEKWQAEQAARIRRANKALRFHKMYGPEGKL